MKKRIITGAVLLLTLIPIFLIEALLPLFYAVIIIFTGMASYEVITANKAEKVPLLAVIVIIALTLFTMISVSLWMSVGLTAKKYEQVINTIGKYDLFPLFALTPFLIMTLFVTMREFNVELLGRGLIAILYIGISFASVFTLRLMGVRFVIYLFLITILTDMFAFFIGVKFGKHKMSKTISPKKSWEGAIAGTLVATIIASLFALNYGIFKGNLNPEGHQTLLSSFSRLGDYSKAVQALVIVPVTLVASVFGQIGDLIASKMKRSYDIKDFGDIFPGHGGVIDRFDSALFVSLFLVVAFMVIQMLLPIIEMP